MTITNWDPVSEDEDTLSSNCVYINGTDGLWYLAECENKMNYLCKASEGKNFADHFLDCDIEEIMPLHLQALQPL